MIQSIVQKSLDSWKNLSSGEKVVTVLLGVCATYEIYRAKIAIEACYKVRKVTKQKEQELEQLKKKQAEQKAQAEELNQKANEEAEKAVEEAKRQIEEMKKNDPFKEEIERTLKHANRIVDICNQEG